MTRLLERWEGVTLSGHYTLEQRLGGDERAEFFQTSIAPDGRRAIIKLVPETVVNGPELFDLWHRMRELRHPNLIELIDYGRADLGGEIVVYAVFEDHDDSLASALRRAPLNTLESREVLDSVLSALEYLHAQALVLGALTPDNIVAVGDRVKLWTDTLRQAAGPADYHNDVRLLGELWHDALMTASPRSSEIVGHAADPNPEARWTLAEISAALDSPSPTAPQPTPIPVPASAGSEPPISVPAVSESSITVRDDAPARAQSRPSTSERASSNRFVIWTFVGAAAVLFFILGVNRSRLADFSITPGAAVSPPVEAVPVPVPRPVEPKVTRPTLSNPPQAASAKIWRVIAFTYRGRDAAAKKAQQLNKDNPGIEASVFSPNEKGGYYLVSVGGRMTHEEAMNLQRSTRGKGLPRDLYVQNYSR